MRKCFFLGGLFVLGEFDENTLGVEQLACR